MNPRERLLAIAVLTLVVVGGLGVMAHQFIVAPLSERRARLEALDEDVATKQGRINEILALKPKLDLWRRLSLPADTVMAERVYERYLKDLFRKSGFAEGSISVNPKPPDTNATPKLPGKKEPIYTRLTLLVHGQGTLDCLVDMMDRFYRTSLLHQIKTLEVARPMTAAGPQQQQQKPDELTINMTIEALVLAGAESRAQLLPGPDRKSLALDFATVLRGGPAGLALVPWAVSAAGPLGPRRLAEPHREYLAIAGKNVFFGPAPTERRADTVDVTQYVFLTDITRDGRQTEAWLYDRFNNMWTRLRARGGQMSAAFDSFRVVDNAGEAVVQAKVVQIDDRELVFRVGEKYYTLHLGQSLQEVMDRPLKEAEMKSLGLRKTAANDN